MLSSLEKHREHKVPCALKDYLPKCNSSDAFTKLSARECQMAFQNWVAYRRTDSPDSRTCPLLWCRHNFENLESCLQHVSTCQWLSNAWYWCPQCRRAEIFTPEDSSLAQASMQLIHRKDTKLRRAVSFFKHIARRSRSQERGTSTSSTTCFWDKQSLVAGPDPIPGFPEKEPTDGSPFTRDLSLFDEDFQSKDRQHLVPSSQHGRRPSTLYDMEANALSPLCGVYDGGDEEDAVELATSDPLFSSAQLGDTNVSEMPDSYQDRKASEFGTRPHPPSQYGPFSLSLYEGIVSPISSDLGLQDPIDRGVTSLTGPISPLGTAHKSQWLDSNESCHDSVASMVDLPTSVARILKSSNSEFHIQQRSTLDRGTKGKSTSTNSPTSNQDGAAENVQTACSERLVEDLDILVSGMTYLPELPKLWKALGSDRSLGVDSHTLTPSKAEVRDLSSNHNFCGLSFFEAGLRALQQCFQGAPPVTFEGVLSIVQLAYACAYLLHDVDHSWPALFENALQWQNLIQCDEDRALYVTTVHWLWDPRSSVEDSSRAFDAPKGKVLALPPIPSPGSKRLDRHEEHKALHDSVPKLCRWSQTSSSSGSSTSAWWVVLREGSVVSACSSYLDAIEYVNITSRCKEAVTSSDPMVVDLSAHEETLNTTIIEPLLQWYGIDGFRQGLVETQDKLSQGLLRNVREVEVMLVQAAKCSQQPPTMEQAYLETILALCDSAMQQMNPTWRDRYYAAYVDGVLAISLELQNRQQRTSCTRAKRPSPINTALANSGQSRSVPSQVSSVLPSASSSAGQNVRNSYSSSATSSTFETPTIAAWSQNTSASNSNWTTPQVTPEKSIFTIPPTKQSMSTVPASPTSSTNTSTKISFCPTCNAAFSGNLQYRTSNLRRHDRTVHRRQSKLLCPEPGCGVECGRSDNLRKHRRTAHGVEEPVRRQIRGKRRRGSEVAEITNWI